VTGPWLFSRRLDLVLFGGSTLLALAFLGIGWWTGALHAETPLWVWLATVVGVDVAHVWATTIRVYADREELAARPALYLGTPVFAWAAGVALHALSPLLFWRALAYLAVFHFVRQQYGWVALYRRKNGETDGRLLDSATIYASTLAPLAYWHSHMPRRFHWFLEGDFVPGLPPALGEAALWSLVALLVAFAVKEARRAGRGLAVCWGKLLVVASTALTWSLGIVVLDSDFAFTVTNVLTHGIPYVGLVLATARAKAASRAASGRQPAFADRLVASTGVVVLFLVALALLEEWGWDRLVWHDYGVVFPGPDLAPGPALLSLIVPLLAVPQATHYLLDAFIWRIRPENLEAARALGLHSSAAS
jgi:hypothetical protein